MWVEAKYINCLKHKSCTRRNSDSLCFVDSAEIKLNLTEYSVSHLAQSSRLVSSHHCFSIDRILEGGRADCLRPGKATEIGDL